MDLIQKLNNLKKKIEEAKQNKARKEGQYEELMKTLHVYNCNNIHDAELLIESILKEKKEKELKLEKGLKELMNTVNEIESKTEWNE